MDAMLLVTFRDTITLGTALVAFLVGVPGVIGLLYGAKWKAASDVSRATAEVAEKSRDAYRNAAERLGSEKDEANEYIAVLRAENEHLKSYPFGDEVAELVAKTLDRLDAMSAKRTEDAASMLAAQHAEIEERMVASFELHEQQAHARHEALMKVAADQQQVNEAMLRALSRLMNDRRLA